MTINPIDQIGHGLFSYPVRRIALYMGRSYKEKYVDFRVYKPVLKHLDGIAGPKNMLNITDHFPDLTFRILCTST